MLDIRSDTLTLERKMKTLLRTGLCDLLDIEYPIIQAGMGAMMGDWRGAAATAELVAAVGNAGGMGVLGASRLFPEQLRSEIRKVRQLTERPFGVDVLMPAALPTKDTSPESELQVSPEQMAVVKGFVSRLKRELGLPETPPPEQPLLTWDHVRKLVAVSFEENVSLIASGLGSPGWLVPEAREKGIKVLAVVGNVRTARRLAQEGVDIIVAQGYEGGGHTGRIGTMALVPQVVDAISPTPVVAAGGIADGRGLVAALALGATGIWCGTVFLATHEANLEDFQKQKILHAGDEDTRVTRIYTGKTARQIKNRLIEMWEQAGVAALPYPWQGKITSELTAALKQAQMTDYLSGYAGQSSGLITEIKSAGDVIRDIVDQAVETLSQGLPARVTVANPKC